MGRLAFVALLVGCCSALDGSWRWSRDPCDASDPDLEITVPSTGVLPVALALRAAAAFRRCGVVALHGAVPIDSIRRVRSRVERGTRDALFTCLGLRCASRPSHSFRGNH